MILTIKPWVIFLAIIIVSTFSETIIGDLLFGILFLLVTYWTLSTGEILYNKLKDKSILNLKQFKLQIYFVVTYLFLVFIFLGGYEINNENISEYGWKAWLIIPLHFLMFFCMIHTIYFLSKCITTLRNKKEGYGWYMLGFWMFPIGIWIIQPRIIKLLNNDSPKQNTL
ncbi:hypothetical protein [Tenacibaculum aquimarinum]|uniref:hypothetical protein n=1 Tax=Tenacibaculum aquimarinum TaxID=2910675 RepID=UPI001F0B2192|nr:hypothetical protein [Tenacibaculum aquimarinum]MCH3885053.1 hypothetical protein [Tenacibaculum aquimarinum]